MSNKKLRKTVKGAYDKMNLKSNYDRKNEVVYTILNLDEQLESVGQFVHLSKTYGKVITLFPKEVEESLLNHVCNDVLELNNQIIMGSYGVDRDTGRILFTSTFYLSKSKSDDKIAEKHIRLGFYSMKHFYGEIWTKYHESEILGECNLPNEEQTYVPKKYDGRFDPMIN